MNEAWFILIFCSCESVLNERDWIHVPRRWEKKIHQAKSMLQVDHVIKTLLEQTPYSESNLRFLYTSLLLEVPI